MENEKDRPQLLDTLGATLGELFGDGLNEATDPVKASVLAGLNGRRVRIAVEITMPLHVAFGVVNVDGTSAVRLFEIADARGKPVTITPLAPGSSDAVN